MVDSVRRYLICIAIATGPVASAQLLTMDPSLKVSAVDVKNYTRTAPIPELDTLARVLATECALTPAINDVEVSRACAFGEALTEFKAARSALIPHLSHEPEEILTGMLILREPTRRAPELPGKLRRYLLARRWLELTNQAAYKIVKRWWSPVAGDYFRYVHPQSEAALEGVLEVASLAKFHAALICTEPACEHSRQELTRVIATVVAPVSRHRLQVPAAKTQAIATFDEYAALRRTLLLHQLRREFEEAAPDAVVVGRLLRQPETVDLTAERQTIDRAVGSWIAEMLRIPLLPAQHDEIARLQMLVQALEAARFMAAAVDPTLSRLPPYADSFLSGVDAASHSIILGGIKWEARAQRSQ